MPELLSSENSAVLSAEQVTLLRDELDSHKHLSTMAVLMNAAGSDTRMQILYLLWRNGEVRVNDLASILELTTPAISQQLKKLRQCEVVHNRRDAQTVFYRLNRECSLVKCVIAYFEEDPIDSSSLHR